MSDIKIQSGIIVDESTNNQWFIRIHYKNYQVIQIKDFKFITNKCNKGHIKYRYSILENLEQLTGLNSEPLKLYDGSGDVSVTLSTSKKQLEYKFWEDMNLIRIPKYELAELLLSNQLSESFCNTVLKLTQPKNHKLGEFN